MAVGFVLESFGSGCCPSVDDLLDSIKIGKFLDNVNGYYWHFEKGSAAWSVRGYPPHVQPYCRISCLRPLSKHIPLFRY
jgi:hypothetical protein